MSDSGGGERDARGRSTRYTWRANGRNNLADRLLLALSGPAIHCAQHLNHDSPLYQSPKLLLKRVQVRVERSVHSDSRFNFVHGRFQLLGCQHSPSHQDILECDGTHIRPSYRVNQDSNVLADHPVDCPEDLLLLGAKRTHLPASLGIL
jgi:hypothetical protein